VAVVSSVVSGSAVDYLSLKTRFVVCPSLNDHVVCRVGRLSSSSNFFIESHDVEPCSLCHSCLLVCGMMQTVSAIIAVKHQSSEVTCIVTSAKLCFT